ncbi:MAG: phosphodiester glycosidase family protein [Muribaculaceae bacterium]|nr:phosphodiester glycosidase family protein [Muribaculaceae bacterium]
MKKMLSALAVGSLCAMPMMGETYHTKGYGVMQTDDIYTVTIGPGTVETKTVINFSTSASDNIEDINAKTTANILKVDLTNEYVTPKVGFADDHAIQDVWMTIPKMMAKHTSYQNHYFAGVNGDFFGYITCGVTVADGKYVYAGNFLNDKAPFEGNHFIIDKDGLPYIADHIEFGCNLGIRNGYSGPNADFGEVTFPDGTTYDEMRYNAKDRWTDYLVLCSPYVNRTSTGFNKYGTEVELRNAGNQTMFGAAGEFKVGAKTVSNTGGDMAIPADGFVLSGVNARSFNDKVNTGDKVKLYIPFKADGEANSCRETVGGWPRLVTDGTPLSAVPSQTPSDLGGSSRRARTAVGFSQDRKTLYIIVLDEGTTKNQGMTFKALGSFMEAIGCYNAMNLDGGGSSVLHVENLGQRSAVQGVMNGYNRPVMNGLFLATNAPEDREIVSIEIVDKALNIKPGKGYVPTIYGYNKYGVLVCTDVTEFKLSAPEGTATFNSGDRKMIAPASGEFTLTAKYNDATFEIPVKVSADGIDGEDPATEATFAEQKTTPVPEKPADWDDDDPSVDPGTEKAIYVAGNFNGWKPEDPMIVTATEGKTDVYEFDINFDSGKNEGIQFKFTTLDPRTNGGWGAFTAGDKGVGVTWHIDGIFAPGKEIELIPGNDSNITTLWDGNYHFTIDLEAATIVATTETPRPALTAPEHLYLIGSLTDHDWDTTYEGAELTGKDGVFTIENVTLAGDDASYFSFITKTAATWDEVNASPRYGAWKNDAEIKVEDDFFECWNSWKTTPGEYTITVDFNTGKVELEQNIDAIYAKLVDITPAGYDWDKYPVGPFAARQIPTDIAGDWWTAPGGTYTQELMDENGQVISIHQRGGNAQINNDELFADLQTGLSIQDLGGYIGKVLVYNQQFGPGDNVHGWPFSTKYPSTQISFYLDANKRERGGIDKAIRVRLVFQVLHRGRHVEDDVQVPTIYACAANASTAWPLNHNGVADTETGEKFPIDAKAFYRWENEGDCIAEMPEEKVLLDGTGTPEPWDVGNTTNKYLINGERFMVYEWDVYSDHIGTIGIHFNIAGKQNRYNTYIFKEIKFYNIVNGEEVATQPRAAAPARVEEAANEFTSTTAYGSLAGTRNISYRYYTEKGIEEIEDYKAPEQSGVEDVIENASDAPAVYYNLQGIRVNNPANGIYIVKQGDKARKVLVK